MRALAGPHAPPPGTKRERAPGQPARCNILGPTALGFRHRDDLREVRELLQRLGIEINVIAPLDATPADLARLGDADFNVVLYPEVALPAAQWLQRSFGQPLVKTVPIGVRRHAANSSARWRRWPASTRSRRWTTRVRARPGMRARSTPPT